MGRWFVPLAAAASVFVVMSLRTLSDRYERNDVKTQVKMLQGQLHNAEVAREMALGLVSSCFGPKETAK